MTSSGPSGLGAVEGGDEELDERDGGEEIVWLSGPL